MGASLSHEFCLFFFNQILSSFKLSFSPSLFPPSPDDVVNTPLAQYFKMYVFCSLCVCTYLMCVAAPHPRHFHLPSFKVTEMSLRGPFTVALSGVPLFHPVLAPIAHVMS